MPEIINTENGFELQTPMGNKVSTSCDNTKRVVEGFVIDKDTGEKYQLSDEILDGIEAARKAEAIANGHDNESDWQKSLKDVKQKQSEYLYRLIGQAADFLVAKTN